MSRVRVCIIAGSIFAALGPHAASAQSASAPGGWTGAYAGIAGGYARGRSDLRSAIDCSATSLAVSYLCAQGFPTSLRDAAVVSSTLNADLAPRGYMGGAHAGYLWQAGSLVYGLEADISALDLATATGTTVDRVLFGPAATRFSTSLGMEATWLSTLRARAGLLVTQNLLVYGTGGIALTSLRVAHTYGDNDLHAPDTIGGKAASSSTSVRSGWALGAGAELQFGSHWRLRTEFLHVDFGEVRVRSAITNSGHVGAATPISTSADLTAQIARAGLSYRF